MSTPDLSAAACPPCGTPPKIVVTRRSLTAANGCSVAAIWLASSRVGARTSPDGRDGRRGCPASLLTIGIEKASVLPLPVLPRPRTSWPASVSGSVSIWMGNGWVIPRAASTSMSGSPTPRSANFLPVVTFMSFKIGCAEVAAKYARSASTRWRDCRWAKSIAAIRNCAGFSASATRSGPTPEG